MIALPMSVQIQGINSRWTYAGTALSKRSGTVSIHMQSRQRPLLQSHNFKGSVGAVDT